MRRVTLGTATLTTGNDNTSTTFSGGISGTGGLTGIQAAAHVHHRPPNAYTGGTTINGGAISSTWPPRQAAPAS